MRLVQTLHFAAATNLPAHTAGWLRWYILGAVALVAVVAWMCLRGYAKASQDGDEK